MDTFSIDAALSALPQAGVGGLLVALVGILLKREAGTQARFNEEYKRLRESYESGLASLTAQVVSLQEKIDDLQLKLDLEREERRKAEDEAAQARRDYGGML